MADKKLRTFRLSYRAGKHEHVYREVYTAETDNPERYAADMLDRFNASLRPGEEPRTLLNVKRLPLARFVDHDWGKMNLVTIKRGGDYVDLMQCLRCGVTGVRRGLGAGVSRDKKYRDEQFAKCDLQKLKEKK